MVERVPSSPCGRLLIGYLRQRASFGILRVKIPATKPAIPIGTIFSRTRASFARPKYPAKQIARFRGNDCNTSRSASRPHSSRRLSHPASTASRSFAILIRLRRQRVRHD
jgi:hypothetical protein